MSEIKRLRPHGAVVARIGRLPERALRIAAITVVETQAGIVKTREQDTAKAIEIEGWLEKLPGANSVVPLDAASMRTWAGLMHRRSQDLYENAMIAATALVHRFTVATRNVGPSRHSACSSSTLSIIEVHANKPRARPETCSVR